MMFDARDILAYLSDKKCYGKEIFSYIKINNKTGEYTVILRSDYFEKMYVIDPLKIEGDITTIMSLIYDDFRESYREYIPYD